MTEQIPLEPAPKKRRRPRVYFRAGVGIVIVKDDKVLLLERANRPGAWQFPQGGMKKGEEPIDTAYREATEETGIPKSSLRLMGRHPDLLAYELPPDYRNKRTGRGQTQSWFFMAFEGPDSEIDTSETHEFTSWRWVSMAEAVQQTVPFRQPLYACLAEGLRGIPRDGDRDPKGPVTLREINRENLVDIIKLGVTRYQQLFVANNGISIAQALFEPHSWMRGIYAGDLPVGFVLLYDNPEDGLKHTPPKLQADGKTPLPEYYLWRLLIDSRYQGLGYGREAVARVIDYVKTRPNADHLLVSYTPGQGTPEPFYTKLGFKKTGQIEKGEVVMRLDFIKSP